MNMLSPLMKNKPVIVVFPLLWLLSGCSTMPEQESPKPVAKTAKPKAGANAKAPAAKKPPPPVVRKDPPGTATYAIDDGKANFKVEPSVPATLQVQPLVPQAETPASAAVTAPGSVAMTTPGNSVMSPALSLSVPATGTVTAPAPPAAQGMQAVAVEDVRVPSGASPAVVALISEADRSRVAGDYDAAVIATERALRIDPRSPALTYKLAQLRVKQNKPQLAEELASKAALLAGSDLDLKRKSWLLIAEARRMQQNYAGAKEAKAKAESF